MMRFILSKVTGGARLGLLTELQSLSSSTTIETPMCMVYTRGGRTDIPVIFKLKQG